MRFGVAAAGHGDDHVFLGDEVLGAHVALVGDQPGLALVPQLADDLADSSAMTSRWRSVEGRMAS